MDALKDSISRGKHRCDTPMPCPLGALVRATRRAERTPAGREGADSAQEKGDPVDSAETLLTPHLAKNAHAPPLPRRWRTARCKAKGSTSELSYVVDCSCEAREVAIWTADEPDILGSLAKVDFLKDSISSQRDISMTTLPCGCNSWRPRVARTTRRTQAKKLDKIKSRSTVQNPCPPHPLRIPVYGAPPCLSHAIYHRCEARIGDEGDGRT